MGKLKCWEVLPELFIDRLRSSVPRQDQKDVLESFCLKKPTTFRANTLKMSADQLALALDGLGILYQRVDWYPDAFVLVPRHPGKRSASRIGTSSEPCADSGQAGMTEDAVLENNKKQLTDTDLYKTGCLYVQSLSSMIPPLVLDPQPREKVLDIAAAPGSKTTQMAMMMNNEGAIVANDKSHVRMYKLKANLQMQGVTNTTTTQMAGQSLWYRYQEYFDKALVDVPCSMEGRFCTDDPESYADWSVKKIKELVQIQRFLLRSAISATRPGGVVVYSTCTLAPEENEGVIDWILQKEGEAIEVLPMDGRFPGMSSGLTHWNDKQYHHSLSETKRIFPSSLMEGFYVALLRKKQSTVSSRRNFAL